MRVGELMVGGWWLEDEVRSLKLVMASTKIVTNLMARPQSFFAIGTVLYNSTDITSPSNSTYIKTVNKEQGSVSSLPQFFLLIP